MATHLDRRNELLLASLLGGSMPRNLRWGDVVELVGRLGTVEPHGGNEFAFVVGSQRAFFKHAGEHTIEVSEISRLRKFLREAGLGVIADKAAERIRMVVVIDHHIARIFKGLDGGGHPSVDAVRPYDPNGFHRHLIHRKEAHYKGEHVPEELSFYEEVAHALEPAQEIVMIGHGTGKSSSVDILAAYL